MPRSSFLARLALPLAVAAGTAAVAPAAVAPMYRATLAAPGVTATVVRDLRWQCAGTVCTAPFTATSADATVCAAVVRKLGEVTAFTAGEHAFDATALQRCNQAKR